MKKSVLESFIRRYSLNGICEAAHWYSDAEKQTLTAKAHTETKSVILKAILKKWEGVETCKLAFPSSTKVKSMLGPIGDEIVFTLNKIRDRVANVIISDDDCEAICTVSDYDAFPETLDTDDAEIPTEFDVEIKLTEEFIDKLQKSISALNESKDFVLLNNKKGGLDMVINYEDTNTNRIRLKVDTIEGKDKIDSPIALSTPILKAVIQANEKDQPKKPKAVKTADSTDVSPTDVVAVPEFVPLLKVSSRGIAILTFEDELFKTTYFLFPTRLIE